MSILVLGDNERAHIALAIQAARAKPMPLSVVQQIAQPDSAQLDLADRRGPVELARMEYPPQQVMLGTYRAMFSFAEQPSGLFRQLSVSSARKGRVPGPEVLAIVCKEFGFSDVICDAFQSVDRESINQPGRTWPGRIWAEEFEPDHYAINVTELETAK